MQEYWAYQLGIDDQIRERMEPESETDQGTPALQRRYDRGLAGVRIVAKLDDGSE